MILMPAGVVHYPISELSGNSKVVAMQRRNLASALATNNKCGLQLVSVVLNSANPSWTVPPNTYAIESILGVGGAGSPSSGAYGYTSETSTTYTYSDGTSSTSSSGVSDHPFSTPTPPSYCEAGPSGTVVGFNITYTSRVCYFNNSYNNYSPSTNGAAITAFGYTFPGGVGSVAPTVTITTQLLVQPGDTFSFNFVSGSSVTITYYQ